jgi:GTP-binding protein EngB required for normal cell division
MVESPKMLDIEEAAGPPEPVPFDDLVDRALALARELPVSCQIYVRQIEELRERLALGRLHLAVLGQFNRGKSTFINALLGFDVLPVSVLPLTSVPTEIRFGETVSCTIRFSNGKPDLRESKNADMAGLLQSFVTEEGNPQNTHQVSEAILECPSEILRHGTVLIDTPGFGSTFVHNTQTTLDLVSRCDAAVLVLSADLPITQHEIEFLREVHRFVPRIFFVYNKIDLLNQADLEKTKAFILEVLRKNLPGAMAPHLFPVSARTAVEDRSEAHWKKSGLPEVKSGIVDFMVREKYFTLSHALNKKFKEAVAGLTAILNARMQELQHPIDQAHARVAECQALLQPVQLTMARERGFSAVERRLLVEQVSMLIQHRKPELERAAMVAFGELLGTTWLNAEMLQAVFGRLFKDAFERVFVEAVAEVNQIVRAAAAPHRREFERTKHIIDNLLNKPGDSGNHGDDPFVLAEVPAADVWEMADPKTSIGSISIKFLDQILAKSRRKNKILERIKPVFLEIVDINATLMIGRMHAVIGQRLDAVERELDNRYAAFQQVMTDALRRCTDALQATSEESRIEREQIRAWLAGFEKLSQLLTT